MKASAINTIEHRHTFERLIAAADTEGADGGEVAFAILYAALAVATTRLGSDAVTRAATDFLAGDAPTH